MAYYVYLLRCADGSLYAGSTNNLARRVAAHNNLKSGSRYTKSRRPVTLAYSEKLRTRRAALRREAEVKRLTRAQKLRLISEA